MISKIDIELDVPTLHNSEKSKSIAAQEIHIQRLQDKVLYLQKKNDEKIKCSYISDLKQIKFPLRIPSISQAMNDLFILVAVTGSLISLISLIYYNLGNK